MPSLNYDEVVAIQQNRANQVLRDAVIRNTRLFQMIAQTGPSNGGKTTAWLSVAGSTAEAYDEGDAWSAPTKAEEVKIELEPAMFHDSLRITGKMRDAWQNQTALQIANWMQNRIDDKWRAIAALVESKIHGGVDTKGFVGLAAAIEDGNTYGGVDRTTVTAARSYVNDNGGTPRALTTTLLNALRKGLTDTNQGNATHALASYSQVENLRGLTQDSHKLGGQVFVRPGEPMELSIGIGTTMTSGLLLFGLPVIVVPGYPTDRIDLVDMGVDSLALEVHRNPTISPVEVQGDDHIIHMTLSAQLILKNPRKTSARLGDLS